ncbi:MAG TPA: glycoside hydrolase family 3 protein [Egibacteraceae bacterium]|jgi:beta-N-acetylhexosaminidase|nr:glycoside hydrolase family 3 protein [Egibacteraceae bacterium]
MSLEDKAAQLIFVHIYGGHADGGVAELDDSNKRLYGVASPREVIEGLQPGGVIYIKRNPQDAAAADIPTRNLESLNQLRALSTALQDASATGLLIATDQEQGPVRRLPPPASVVLGGRELGATGDVDLARSIAKTTGQELLEVGINLNLAPVADVNTVADNPAIGDRSFGNSPELVAAMVTAQIRGYHDAGVAATAKHFPGHGAATVDSHSDLTLIDISEEEWKLTHLPPFAAAITADVDAIMTGHLLAPGLGGDDPATIDRDVVEGLLRGQLAFPGLILTDSLWMQGVRGVAGDVEVALRALEAGCDVLLMPPDARATIHGIIEAVATGRLSEARLDHSVRRLLTLKAKLGALKP